MSRKLIIAAGTALAVCAMIATAMPLPAVAAVMQWSTVITPDATNNLIVSPSEVSVIAVSPDGVTVYASDIPHQKVYKSVNAGYGWSDITNSLTSSGASLPVWNIKFAPDNPSIMAAVTSSGGQPRAVYITMDGGAHWQNMNIGVSQDICALDISPLYGTYDLAAGTRNGSGGGKLYTFKMTGTGTWAEQGITGDILDIAFSPNYASDNSLVLIASPGTGTFAYLGLHDTGANATNFGTWAPVELTASGAGTSPGANQVRTADVELPSDFMGQTSGLRKFFVSTNDANTTGNAGIFRIDDNIIYRIFQASGTRMVSSISYSGTTTSGKLLEGEVKANASQATVDVQYCLNAAASCPQATCLTWQKSQKLPTGGAGGGNGNAQVEWSRDGSRAFCGTSSADIAGAGWPGGYAISQPLDESAFSYSGDAAVTWNQVGLIDTQVSFLADVSATPASDTLYLATINTGPGNTGFDSFWRRSTPAWERVLCLLTSNNQLLVRVNESRPTQVFVAVPSTAMLMGSPDSGLSWVSIQPGTNITDFRVEVINNAPSIFILSEGTMRRGDYTGTIWRWAPPVGTGLPSGNMIRAYSNGVVLAGDRQGGVAISGDAGNTFAVLPQLPVPGNVQVILDDRVREPYLIHAATDSPGSGIYAWILGASSRWLDMQPPRTAYYGLAQLNTFYGCSSNGINSAVVRTLQPEQISMAEWDTMQAGLAPGVLFTRQPSALSISSGVVLLAIDNRPYSSTSGKLWQYGDALAAGSGGGISQLPPIESLLQAPVVSSPSANSVVEPDSSGKIPPIEFRWQQSTAPNGYDLWIAADPDFNQVVLKQPVTPTNVMAPGFVLEPGGSPLEPGRTYYWRVRVNRIANTYQKIDGSWSAVSSFRIASGPQVSAMPLPAPALVYPADKATNIGDPVSFQWSAVPGATGYQFTLARDEQLKQILADSRTQGNEYRYTAPLEEGKIYYWQVKATGPGTGQPSQVFSFSTKGGTAVTTTPAEKPGAPGIPAWVYIGLAAVIVILIVLIVVFSRRRSF
jgi:hypothetical protein